MYKKIYNELRQSAITPVRNCWRFFNFSVVANVPRTCGEAIVFFKR